MTCWDTVAAVKSIPHNRPSLGDEEVQAVEAVLRRNWVIAGEEVARFEDSLGRYTGRRYATAVNSGHAALHLSLLALDVKQGDEVIIPAYTTADLLNVIYYCRAVPVIVDVARDTFTIDPAQVGVAITTKTKAVIVPHMFGFPADLGPIQAFGIPVVEDCAQAAGSSYHGTPVGGSGDLSVFSFYASKVITTGQGGMLLTDSLVHHETIRDLIDYNGFTSYRVRYNYPMTDIGAAVGNVQFQRLERIIARKKNVAQAYREVLDRHGVSYSPRRDQTDVNHFRFLLKLDTEADVRRMREELEVRGVRAIVPYPPVELPYSILHEDAERYPNSVQLATKLLSLPIYSGLTDENVTQVTNALDEVLRQRAAAQ